MKLYKVKVETEIMVVADNEKSAIEVAKTNAPNEVSTYGKCTLSETKRASEIPDDWRSVIPYAPHGVIETKKCYEFISASLVPDKGLEKDEMDHIIKLQTTKKIIEATIENEVKPETRPDPTPKEMDWHDTKSGRPMQKLRFVK